MNFANFSIAVSKADACQVSYPASLTVIGYVRARTNVQTMIFSSLF